MLDLKHIAQNFDAVVERLRTRGPNLDLGPFQRLVLERKDLYVAMESLNHRRNVTNEDM
jgi:seryl-tRNA synthetase